MFAAAAVAGAGVLAAAGALAAPASAQTAPAGTASATRLHVQRIAFGDKLHHVFRPHGTGTPRSESLTSPDDITRLGQDIFVNFQNGVGAQGEAAPDGNLDSTIVEFTLAGREVAQWDLRGKSDGLTADPLTGQVISTVNEDANSSLYTINPCTRRVTHYAYSEPLPHKGGTDSIAVYQGRLLISASAPGTTGGSAPSAADPAVYVTTLDSRHKIARITPLYSDEAPAYQADGTAAGKTVKLALVDPDSSEVVPWSAPKYAGQFVLDSQADQELIFDRVTAGGNHLTALHLSGSVDDSAWVTTPHGALYIPDATDDTVDMVTGTFKVGTMYSSVTPCDSGTAPATCPGPGYPDNYLASANMTTGVLTPVPLSGPALHTKGMVFVP
ncbi:MAG TPA: hypothetical protein VHV09_17105 [Trebonia sp.]|jgi:hypothetical protein|nr:hypothetical protein [Trebonia sp.]